jgi:ribosomal protein S27AE
MTDDEPDLDDGGELIETCSNCGDSLLSAYLTGGECGECRE